MALAVECKNMNDLGIAEKAKEGIASSAGQKFSTIIRILERKCTTKCNKILLALSGSPNLVPTLIQAGVRASGKIIDQKRRVKRYNGNGWANDL